MKKILLFSISILFTALSYGQNNFRSVGSGDWNNASIWEEEVGGLWVTPAPSGAPTASSPYITISHDITIPSSVTAIIGGTLEIEVDDDPFFGSGLEGSLQVFGSLRLNQGASFVNDLSTRISFKSGSIYQHNYVSSAGSIPLATWEDGSTLEIIGYTSGSHTPVNLNQNFYNVVINLSSLSANYLFNGSLTTVRNDLLINSTNGRLFGLSQSTAYTLSIGRDFIINNNSTIALNNTSTAVATINVGRNFSYNSTIAGNSWLAINANSTINIENNFLVNSGSLTMGHSSGTGISTINLKGNFIVSGNRLVNATSSRGIINFNGNSNEQLVNLAPTTPPNVNYTIRSNARARFPAGNFLGGMGNFTLEGNGRLIIESPNGIDNSSTTGPLRVPVSNRFYNAGGIISFEGSSNQVLGEGFPAGNVNLIINNPAGVSLIEDYTVTSGRYLTLQSGNLNISARTLILNGAINASGGYLETTNLSKLVIGGTGALGTIPFSPSSTEIESLTLNRTSSGTATLGSDIEIFENLTLTNGTLIFNNRTLTLNGSLTRSGGNLAGNSGSTLVLKGATELGDALSFTAGGSSIRSLIVEKLSSNVSIASNLTLAEELQLTQGNLIAEQNITVSNGATVYRTAGTINKNLIGTSYNLVYLAAVTPSFELPTSTTALNNLTIDLTSGTLNLNRNVTVNGSFTIATGNFNVSNRTITFNGPFPSLNSSSFLTSNQSGIGVGGSSPVTFPSFLTELRRVVISNPSVSLSGALTLGDTLQIGTGAVLSIGNNTLTNNGRFVGEGSLRGGNESNLAVSGIGGTVRMVQTTAADRTINNLTLSGSPTLTLGNQMDVRGIATLANGTIASGGNLLVNLNTGSIAYNTGETGQITGELRTSKVTGSNRYWHFFTPTLRGTTIGTVNSSVPIMAGSANRMYMWNESAGWQAKNNTNLGDAIPSATGFLFSAPNNSNLRFAGTYQHNTDVTVNLGISGPTEANQELPGRHLLGNPFPSALNWDLLFPTLPSDMNNAYYVQKDGKYEVYVGTGGDDLGISTGTIGNMIPSMQGFFVKVDGPCTFTIPNSARSNSIMPVHRISNTPHNLLKLNISNGEFYDVTIVRFRENATPEFDNAFDALKMTNDGEHPNIFSSNEGTTYAVNTLPESFVEYKLPLTVEAKASGSYKFTAEDTDSFDSDYSVILEDKETNTFTNLKKGEEYSFEAEAETYEGRFYLNFRKLKEDEEEELTNINKEVSEQVKIYSSESAVYFKMTNVNADRMSFKIYDILGQEVAKETNVNITSGSYTYNTSLKEGIYIVKMIINNQAVTGKVYIE
ncbi:MAG: T9SS type A sorting domain-containing protein [Cytophagaceae bacterium]